VSWFDDFLGSDLNPGYSKSFAGSGNIDMASIPAIGGVLMLWASAYESGAARLRFGEDPVSGPPYNALNFSAKKNLVYKARVFLNCDTDVEVTVGLIGYHDPEYVLAALYTAGEEKATWGLEVGNGEHHTAVATDFRHTPGIWFTVKIVAEWGETPVARLFIDDQQMAEVVGDYVPEEGLCPEFQIWNMPLQSGWWSQPSLYIDYLSVTQDR
jgi:hypothetical protein